MGVSCCTSHASIQFVRPLYATVDNVMSLLTTAMLCCRSGEASAPGEASASAEESGSEQDLLTNITGNILLVKGAMATALLHILSCSESKTLGRRSLAIVPLRKASHYDSSCIAGGAGGDDDTEADRETLADRLEQQQSAWKVGASADTSPLQ